MPVYAFTCDCGKNTERECCMADAPKTVKCECGQKMYRDFAVEQGRYRRNVSVDHASEALAVHPSEIQETIKSDKKIGSSPDFYDNSGIPHWTGDIGTVLQRKARYMRDRGFCEISKC